MQQLISRTDVVEAVKQAAAETLRIDAATIRPDHSFVRDLGLESLDFLDIDYRLEQTFGIKMARHFFLEHAEDLFGEGSAIDADGRLTSQAIELLKSRYDPTRLPDLSSGLDMDQVSGLITVDSMSDAVMGILDTLPERCACGASAWKNGEGRRIVCSACGAPAAYTNGDELIRQWLTGIQAERNLFSA